MSSLKVGDWVEVKSKSEILQTLDKNGRLNELPFMPQMFQYCGQRFQVYRSAHKTCDTVSGAYTGRTLPGGIHLDLRCDGQAYDGCKAGCLIFWHDAWLKPVVDGATAVQVSSHVANSTMANAVCQEADVWKATKAPSQTPDGEPLYVCQATHLLKYTTFLPWYDVRQYVEDYRRGNVSLGRIARGFIYVAYYYGSFSYKGDYGRPGRWLYNTFQSLWGGLPFPRRNGILPPDRPTPKLELNLQPGELVRVKSLDEIRKTLDTNETNRGMAFDAELVPYCGGTYRVKSRIDKFVNEKTGKMTRLKTPAVILEGVFCEARYSSCRMFCPRAIYSWWREIWLERVKE